MKQKIIMFTILLIFTLSFGFAMQPIPHAFKGQIFSEDGSLTDGKMLIAQINGITTGSCVIDGNSYDLIVIDNLGSGGIIEFFIGEEKAHESYNFVTFKITKTNLTFDTIPDETTGSCGDGICAVEECSFCAIDCSVSQCINNGICDSAIGEDIVTAPSDCSICGDGICSGTETCSSCSIDCGSCFDSSDDNDDSGSSSGGSSTSSSSQKESIPKTILNSGEDNEAEIISINSLNENIDSSDLQPKRKGITGFAVATLGETGSAITGFMVLGLLVVGFIFIRRRKLKKRK